MSVFLKRLNKIMSGLVVFLLVFGWWFNPWWQITILKNPEIKIPPKIEEAGAAAGDILLMWDTVYGNSPTGWDCVSCATTSPFYQTFLKAGSTYSVATSGYTTHTHGGVGIYSAGSANQGDSGTGVGDTGGTKGSINTHTHNWKGPSIASGDFTPPYQNFKIISASSTNIAPSNVVAIFDNATMPTGWTAYATTNNYIRGYSDNATGGATTHTHNIGSLKTDTVVATLSDTGNSGTGMGGNSHTWPTSSTTPTEASNNPPYIGVILARNSSGATTTIPAGAIAIFNATVPSGWTMISDAQPWVERLLVASTTFGNTGGASSTHNHGGSISGISGAAAAGFTNAGTASTTAPGGVMAAAAHTHANVAYTIGNSSENWPPWRRVILGKRNAVLNANFQDVQKSSLSVGSANQYVGGAFTFESNASSSINITGIVVTESGTVNANANLSNLDIYYETVASCTYNGDETLFGTGASFNASEKTTVSGTLTVAGFSHVCVYAVLDVGAGASADETLEISISNPSTEVTVSLGAVEPATAVNIPETSTLAVSTSVTCTTALDSDTTAFSTIDNVAIYASVPDATTSVTTNSATGFTMKIYGAGSTNNPGLYKNPDLIESPNGAWNATATLLAGIDGYGIQATTSSGNNIGIDPRYKWATSTNVIGGLATSSGTAFLVASSSQAVTSQLIMVTHKAAVAITTPAGSYQDVITYVCTVNP